MHRLRILATVSFLASMAVLAAYAAVEVFTESFLRF